MIWDNLMDQLDAAGSLSKSDPCYYPGSYTRRGPDGPEA